MKNLVLILVLMPFLAFGQQEFPLDSTSKWRVEVGQSTNYDCAEVVDYLGFFEGDTTINNLTYKKFYSKGISYYIMLNANAICDSNTYSFSRTYIGAFRNDSNKVFYIKSGYFSPILLYDFSLNVGDTIPAINTSIKIVDSINTININGKSLKQFYFGNDWIIEGIGSCYGLVEISEIPLYKTGYHMAKLLCYAEQDSVLLSPDKYCVLNVGISKNNTYTENKLVRIYPNPSVEKLNIELAEIPKKSIVVELYDITGRLIKVNEFFNQTNYSIDLIDLQEGIYILNIKSNEEFSKSIKIIKN